jgi:fermentation-respiration switch protein FrsA (DUF1100 family)
MLKAALIVLATSYTAWYLQRHELQVVYPFDPTYSAPETTGEARLRETRLATPDGETLILWRAEGEAGRPTVIYFPGNAGTLASRAARFSALLDRGFGVVALAYRGSSGSTGKPDEASLTRDAALVASWAKEAQPDSPVVLYGESLGTAMVVKLAAGGTGDALVLEAPFTSIPDLVLAQFPGEDLSGLMTQIWDNEAAMPAVRQPLLILHGTADRLVPIDHAETLIAVAGSRKKRLLALDGQGHTGLWTVEGQTAIYDFLREAGK